MDTMNNTTPDGGESTSAAAAVVVVTSWTPIWVTLVICAIQGIIFYAFFLYRRNKDRQLYHSERDKLLSLQHPTNNDGNNNNNETSVTSSAPAEVLKHCHLYESRQYTRSHRSPLPFESNIGTTSSDSSGSPKQSSSSSSSSWLASTLSIPNDELLRCVGLDTYMYLRLLYLGTRMTGFGTLLSLILLPIYATGTATGLETEQFNLLTIARVEASGSSWRLFVSVGVWYMFILFILVEFWLEWKMYYQHRTVYDATGDMDMSIEYRYTVRIEKVRNNTDAKLRTYFEQLFPHQVRETASVVPTTALEKLITERQAIILKLEALIASVNGSVKVKPPKQIRVQRLQKVDAKGYYESEIERYNIEIDTVRQSILTNSGLILYKQSQQKQTPTATTTPRILQPQEETATGSTSTAKPEDEEGVETGLEMKFASSTTESMTATTTTSPQQSPLRNVTVDESTYPNNGGMGSNNDTKMDNTNDETAVSPTTTTAFVTFTSLRAKQAAIQCELSGDPDAMIVYPASDPTVGTIWKNVTVPLDRQTMLQFYAACFFTMGILFWAIPVSFITSISNLNSILEVFNLKQANPSAFWYGLVAGLLPVIMLAILMMVLYMVITAAATNFIRYKSWPEVDAYCLYWHMLFQFANLWLLLIGGSLFSQIDVIIDDFNIESFIETIAKAMPSSSVFFVNMIICSSFNAFGMELSMLVKYIVSMIMNMIGPEASKTQRQIDNGKKPPSLVWGQKVPPIIFIFMVSILYMPIVPIISIFAFVYFFGTYVVMKHQCLHVYAQEFEGGGSATWQEVFGFLMACVYIGEFIFITYMGIKTAPIQGGLGFIPLIITCFFHRILYRKYIAPIQNLSQEVAADVDIRDGELSQENDGHIKALYRQPVLDAGQDERGPMPYRRDPVLPRSDTEAV